MDNVTESDKEETQWPNTTTMTTQLEIHTEISKASDSKQLTDEEKKWNYIMSGLAVLLLLVIIAIAKGLHSWQFRRKPWTVPILKGPENSKEAWSGGGSSKQQANTQPIHTRGLKLTNSTPTNGKFLSPNISLPQQLISLQNLHIEDTDDDNRSVSSAISVIKETDMDRISNNIDNYLTNIESQLQVPSSAKSHHSMR